MKGAIIVVMIFVRARERHLLFSRSGRTEAT